MSVAVAARNTGAITTAGTSWSITLPNSGAATGDVYLVIVGATATTTMTTSSSNWTSLGQFGTQPAAVFVGVVGTASSTLTIASSASVKAEYACLRLTGASSNISIASATGNSTTHTSPALTPAAGSQEYYWVIADISSSPPYYAPTAAPSGWSNLQTGSTGGSDTSADVGIATAELDATAATETPGAWSGVFFAGPWTDLTLAVPPGVIPMPDTGSGSDTTAVTATIPAADTGAGTDTAATAVQVPTGDTGASAEGQAAAAAAPDTGSGAETATVAAQTPATDTGSGADTITAGMADTDTDTGHDAAEVAVIAAGATDTGSGTDTAGTVAQVTTGDTGSAADSAIANIGIPMTDTGSGAETAQVAVIVPTSDTGSGTETTGTGIDTTDPGTGSDTAAGFLSGIVVPPDILVYVVPPAYRVPS